MSLRKRRNVVLLAVLHFLMLAAFLPGCKEGTKTSPVSALLTDMDENLTTIDLSQAENSVHTVLGKVVSKNTSEKLDNVTVKLLFENQLVSSSRTTSEGTFYFAKLPPGIYDLKFSKDLYKESSYIIRILEDGTMSPAEPEVKLELISSADIVVKATIEGTVLLSGSNTTLPNINVVLKNQVTNEILSNSLTSATGMFSFTDLAPGSYSIIVGEKSPYVVQPEDFTVRKDGVVLPKFILFQMTPNPIESFSVAGFVKTQSKEALPNFTVELFDQNNGSVKITGNPTITTGEGKFFFDGIKLSGSYYFKVSGSNMTTSDPYPIRILADGSISPELIEIPVIRDDSVTPVSAKGYVYDAFTGGALEYATVKIANLNTSTTDVEGEFSAANLIPGIYSIEISKFGYETMITSFQIKSDKTTIPASLTYPLIHTMKEGYGSIAGRFVDELTGSGTPNLSVRLYAWEQVTKSDYFPVTRIVASQTVTEDVLITETDWEITSSVLLTTRTSNEGDGSIPDMAGSFKLTHLAPGDYVIFINPSADPKPTVMPLGRTGSRFSWNNVVFNQDAAGTGIKALRVVAGQTTYWTNYEQTFIAPKK